MIKKTLEIRDKTIFDGIFVKYILKFLFSIWFKLAGWRVTKNVPEGTGVAIAAPHTSNWDFVYALGAAIIMDVKIYFSIKENWCRIPVVGAIMMWLGAIPIDRSSGGQGQVRKIKAFVERHKNSRVFFLFTPEATRSKVKRWKTGFYHIAENCGLPVFLAKVDYRLKESGVFHTYQLTGDKTEDIAAIQASYKNVQGKFPKTQFPQYSGSIPKISDAEAIILRALYSIKGVATNATNKSALVIGVATRVEIAAKAKLTEISQAILDFLIEVGVLEVVASPENECSKANNLETKYRLTFIGKGCVLHLFPTLA